MYFYVRIMEISSTTNMKIHSDLKMGISSTIEKIGSFISQNLKSFYKFETITPWQKYDILSSASEARTLRLESSNLISSDVSWFCFCKSASWSRIPSETTMVKSKRVPSRWISPRISTKSELEKKKTYLHQTIRAAVSFGGNQRRYLATGYTLRFEHGGVWWNLRTTCRFAKTNPRN